MNETEGLRARTTNWWQSENNVFRTKKRLLGASALALAILPASLALGHKPHAAEYIGEYSEQLLFDTGQVVDELESREVRAQLPESHYVLVPKFASATQVLNQEAAAFGSGMENFDHYRQEVEGVKNGRLPKEGLCKLPWTQKSVVRCDAEHSFELLDQAFKAEFGHDIDITDSYRDFETQVDVRNKLGKTAAVPGYSNHGNGIALDLGSNIPDSSSAEYKWMSENAGKFHWYNPGWAKTTKIEPWHWEYHFDPIEALR